ncbi:MAG TPA: DUF1476 domain-containing protein, partial [Geminicoccus sp.]|uniref:DUF1476 domain-containing protein n=1 Tax=Geminicoccus sp. TaxID=2024832 RepID=UPI002E3537D5
FRHDQEIYFQVRNRRNKLVGLKIANEYLGLKGDDALAYAKEIVMSDFERPGDDDVIEKIRADVSNAGKPLSDHLIQRFLQEAEAQARESVKAA